MRRKTSTLALAASLAAGLAATAATHDDDRGRGTRRLKAELSGFDEYPSTLSTTGRGWFQAQVSADETEILYRLDYRDLEGTITMSHIHFGDHHTSGGISVWLCGTAAQPGPASPAPPTCGPAGDGPEASGTLTKDNVVGPTGQGIAAGEFAELVRAIKAGRTYVNVHTTKYPGGEIRGQIRAY
jgi:hypothetical protein